MPLIRYKPTSDGRRGMTSQDFSMLSKKQKPEKKLTVKLQKHAGRNSSGRITVRHQGGGADQAYRLIDFKRDKAGTSKVISIQYDPYRSARIALIEYTDGEKRYILAPLDIKVGSEILTGDTTTVKPGNAMLLQNIPIGVQIHNVELTPGKGGQLGRSAGTVINLLAKEGKYATIKLASGELRKVLLTCRATIGQLGNPLHSLVVIGKAGRQRHLGIRPTVRGKVMSPRSHPHGGGEAGNSIGLRRGPKTPWGALALGVKTRNKKKKTNLFIVSKRKK